MIFQDKAGLEQRGWIRGELIGKVACCNFLIAQIKQLDA